MSIDISGAREPHHSEFFQAALLCPSSIPSPSTVFIHVLFVTNFSFSWFSCCYGKISDLQQLAYSLSWALSMAGQGVVVAGKLLLPLGGTGRRWR